MITKRFLFIALIVLAYQNLFPQDLSFPKGIYLSIDDINSKKTSIDKDLKVEKRTDGEIKMSGGNDYRLVSLDKTVSKKDIKKKFLGYSTGDTLFINCFHYKVQSWYSPILNKGRYLLFVGGISQENNLFEYQLQETKTSKTLGFFGAIGGGIQGAKLAMLRFPYLIDTEKNELIYLDESSLEELLASHDRSILQKFRSEKATIEKQEELKDLVISYVNLLNDLHPN